MAETDELREEVQELKEELEQLKQEKQSNTTSARSSGAVEEEMTEVADQVRDVTEGSGWSRRDFMKLLGGGAAGLGAVAMIPRAAGYEITSGNPIKFFNQSSSKANLNVTKNGTLHTNQIGTSTEKIQNVHASSVTADKENNTYTPAPGDLQSVLQNDATAEDVVRLHSGYVFTPRTRQPAQPAPVKSSRCLGQLA